MRLVIERVSDAEVLVDQKVVAKITFGLLIYIGVSVTDTFELAEKVAKKVLSLRIFDDSNGKLNLKLQDQLGSILLVSEFTLYGDTKTGARPSFKEAANKDLALAIYNHFSNILKKEVHVAHGVFGSNMVVKASNIGPVTIIMEEKV